VQPPVPQSKPPPVSNKPFIAPPEWKPPALPTVAQKVPPPKAPKPANKPPVKAPPSNINHPNVAEKPSLPQKSPAKSDTTNELVHTDSSSSLETGGHVRSRSRLPPGLDIAVLTRIHPEFDYNAQDFAHKDSLDRRRKDQEVVGHPIVPVFSSDGSDTTREFVPPGGSQSELTQQTSMEEEKDKILAYIKNRKVENKISSDGTEPFMCSVPAEVEAKHQKKHQEKQIRKSLRDKLKRVMPNGRDKKEKDSEMPHHTNWQWSKDLAPPISSTEVNSMSGLPPTSGRTTNSGTSLLPSTTRSNNVPSTNSDTRGNNNNMAVTSFSSGETRGSGVGMEVEQSSSVLPPQQQNKNTSLPTNTTTTSVAGQPTVSTHQQQQREWHSPSNKTIPPQTAPKPSPPVAPKPSILQKPVLKSHPMAASKPSPPIAPKPHRDQLLRKSLETGKEQIATEQVREIHKPVEQPHPSIPSQLQTMTVR